MGLIDAYIEVTHVPASVAGMFCDCPLLCTVPQQCITVAVVHVTTVQLSEPSLTPSQHTG